LHAAKKGHLVVVFVGVLVVYFVPFSWHCCTCFLVECNLMGKQINYFSYV
jgi:hypothetical protein